jgi:hypothetical protein
MPAISSNTFKCSNSLASLGLAKVRADFTTNNLARLALARLETTFIEVID